MTEPIKSDTFEPVKLIAVTERLRAWAEHDNDAQVCEDIKWLLASHLSYFERNERLYRASFYYKHGDDEITWRDYAETLGEDQNRLYYLTDKLHGLKWADLPASLAALCPESKELVEEADLYASIDREIAKEKEKL
jgi:hypothetical protein